MRVFFLTMLSLAFSLPLFAQPIQKIQSPALHQEVQVRIDIYGTPHIKAKNWEDLFFVQGYITAQRRLFQMDILRHRAKGEMAEILGKDAVKNDLLVRKIGFRYQGEAIYRTASEKVKKIVQAYVNGVNAYIAGLKKLPRGYRALHFSPQPWAPQDLLTIGRMVSWGFSGSLEIELGILDLARDAGIATVQELLQVYPADPTTIDSHRYLGSLPRGVLRGVQELERELAELRESVTPAGGFFSSNNWVVSPKKSASGVALLANDTHLSLTTPPYWFEVHLQAPGVNVIGVTYPGAPGVLIGHNEHIAWGATVVGYDVTDLYLESQSRSHPEKYLFKGEEKPYRVRRVSIGYRQGDKIEHEAHKILYTNHGPVLFQKGPLALSFRWTGMEPTGEAEAFLLMDQSKNLQEFRSALDRFKVGAMNFVYADVEGNIFWQATGAVPIRPARCLAYMPLSGASGNCEWQGFIPYAKLPHLFNPPEGFIVTANNRPIGSDYPYYIGYHFDAGFRAHRITELLKLRSKVSFSDMQNIQLDVTSLPARELKPMLLAAFANQSASPKTLKALNLLRHWDHRATKESVGATIFYYFLRAVGKNILEGHLGKKHYQRLGSLTEIPIALLLKEGEESPWFDLKNTPKKETKSDLLRLSFREAVKALHSDLGDDTKEWKWGKVHLLTLHYPLLSQYDIGPLETPGGLHTVNVANFNIVNGFGWSHGPGIRFVAELKQGVSHAVNVIPGGEVDSLKSKHYRDLLALWLGGKAHPQLFTEKAIAANTEQTLVFQK